MPRGTRDPEREKELQQAKLKILSDRAAQVDNRLIDNHPQLAAELLTNAAVKTQGLQMISRATYEAAQRQRTTRPAEPTETRFGLPRAVPVTEDERSFATQLAEGVGGALSAPFRAVGAVGGAGLTQLGDIGVPGAQGLREALGAGARGAEYGIGYGLRTVEGVAVASIQHGFLGGAGAVDPETGERESFVETMQRYVPSPEEFEAGQHSGVTQLWFGLTGLDSEEYEGLAAVIDLTGDIAASEVILRGAMAFRAGRTTASGRFAGEEFVATRPGRSVGDSVWETIEKAPPENVRSVLIDRHKHMSPSMANELARAATRDDVTRIMADIIDDVPGREIPRVQAELDATRRSILEQADGEPAVLNKLRADEIGLAQRLTDLQARETVFEFPSRARIQAFMRGVPGGWTGRMLNRIFGETRLADLSKFTDDLTPRDLKLYDPSIGAKPFDWATHNAEVLRKQFNIAKVPKAIQRQVLEDMLNIKSPQDFFSWRNQVSDAFELGFTRGGRRTLTPEAQQALRWSDSSLEERMSSPIEIAATLPDGTTVRVTRNVLESADGNPLPTQPNEFVGHASLPDIQVLRDASSSIRYFDRWAKSKPVIGKIYGGLRTPLDVARFTALTLPRLLLRPLVLISRLPILLTKIQLDQALRNVASGMKPLAIWRRRNVDFTEAGIPIRPGLRELLPEDPTAIGTVASELFDAAETVTYRVQTRGMNPHTHPRESVQVAGGIWDHVTNLATDELARKVAAYGAEDTLRFLTEHPTTRLGQWYLQDMKPLLERNNITPETWLRNKELEIVQASGGDAALREGIATGRWDVERATPTGAAIELQLRLDELAEARSTLSATESAAARQELNLRIEHLEQVVERAQRATLATNRMALTDRDAFINEISRRWMEERFTVPNEVTVRRSARFTERLPGETFLDRARAKALQANRLLYKGLTPLSKADIYLTRGSTFVQALERTYADLIRRGYEPKLAFERAQHRAAYIARDLHYDIAARSSFDRSMKDLFWFSAVFREQLTTYLYKIPSKSYWPLGFTLRANEAKLIFDGLKELGILEYHTYFDKDANEEKQELVMNVPWASDFIRKLVNNSDAGYLRVGGLNPLTPGTTKLVPTLGPGAQQVLDMTARRLPPSVRPLVEKLASWFEFSEDVSYLPTGVRHVLELAGIHVPFDTLNGEAWGEASRKANVQALKFAMSELAADGILPPGRDASPEEIAAYRTKLEAEARSYERGLAVVHLIGSAILPGSFTTASGVTKAGEAWYAFREKVLDPIEFGTDEYYATMNEYLRTHPAAWPYSVGTHPGEYGTPGYYDTTLAPDDYVEKALRQAYYWREAEGEVAAPSTAEEFGALEPREQQFRTVEFATLSPSELDDIALGVLRFPEFEGRDALLKTLGEIQAAYEERDSSDLSDARREALADERDVLMGRAINKYGEDGERTLRLFEATPAERLDHAQYFQSKPAAPVLAGVDAIARYAVAQGSSPMYAAESTGVLQAKVEFYRWLERVRAFYPGFDREMRRVEIALGEKDTTRGRVGAYEYLFFGQPVDAFGYQSSIVKELR